MMDEKILMAQVDSQSAQQALEMILKAIGISEASYRGKVTIHGKDPILASRHRFCELMAAAQAGFGMALGRLWKLRDGAPQDVCVSVENAVHQHHGIAFMRQNGRKLPFYDYGDAAGVDSPMSSEFYPMQDCFLEKGDIITDDLQTLGTTGVDVKTYFETCMPRTENASMIMQRLYANNLLTTFLYPTSNKEACELNEGCDDLIANDFIQFNEKICVNKTPLRFFNDRHIGRNALEKSFLQDTPSFNTEPVTETGNSFATLGSVFLVGAGFFTLMMLFVVCLYKKRMAESAKEQDPEHEYSYLIPHTMSINFN